MKYKVVVLLVLIIIAALPLTTAADESLLSTDAEKFFSDISTKFIDGYNRAKEMIITDTDLSMSLKDRIMDTTVDYNSASSEAKKSAERGRTLLPRAEALAKGDFTQSTRSTNVVSRFQRLRDLTK